MFAAVQPRHAGDGHPAPCARRDTSYLIRTALEKLGQGNEVHILELPGPGGMATKVQRVKEDGTISLPFVGRISARGHTRSDVNAAAARGYQRENILTQAQLMHSYAAYTPRACGTASTPVFVSGQ